MAQKAKRLERREKIETIVREREKQKIELQQRRWTRREEGDFFRTISNFGVEYNKKLGRYDWTKFRAISRLERKYDETLTEYLRAFCAMCKKACGRKLSEEEEVAQATVEPISEERARRCLERLELLCKIREEVLTHSELDDRLKLCQPSLDLPDWWVCGKHDRDLLMGASRHGLGRTDFYYVHDPELGYREILRRHYAGEPLIYPLEKKERDRIENPTNIDEVVELTPVKVKGEDEPVRSKKTKSEEEHRRQKIKKESSPSPEKVKNKNTEEDENMKILDEEQDKEILDEKEEETCDESKVASPNTATDLSKTQSKNDDCVTSMKKDVEHAEMEMSVADGETPNACIKEAKVVEGNSEKDDENNSIDAKKDDAESSEKNSSAITEMNTETSETKPKEKNEEDSVEKMDEGVEDIEKVDDEKLEKITDKKPAMAADDKSDEDMEVEESVKIKVDITSNEKPEEEKDKDSTITNTEIGNENTSKESLDVEGIPPEALNVSKQEEKEHVENVKNSNHQSNQGEISNSEKKTEDKHEEKNSDLDKKTEEHEEPKSKDAEDLSG